MSCCSGRPTAGNRENPGRRGARAAAAAKLPDSPHGPAPAPPPGRLPATDSASSFRSALDVDFADRETVGVEPGQQVVIAGGGGCGGGEGRAGQVVIGGRWVEAAPGASSAGLTQHLAAGWGTGTHAEADPLSVAEARDLARLAAALGPEAWSELPADLQLAYLRDIYGNPAGCGWSTKGMSAAAAEEFVFEKTLAVMRACCAWRAGIGGICTPHPPPSKYLTN